jgi:hypothetical protein
MHGFGIDAKTAHETVGNLSRAHRSLLLLQQYHCLKEIPPPVCYELTLAPATSPLSSTLLSLVFSDSSVSSCVIGTAFVNRASRV